MNKRLSLAAGPVVLAGVTLIVAGCGGGGSNSSAGYGTASAAPAAVAHARTISTRHTGLGDVLVDSNGRTLYLFEKDKGMDSTCSGACASIWPPLTSSSTPVAGAGLASGKIATIKRADGASEVTYAGHPLYTYVGDAKPGDTKGQGLDQFGAEWYALAPNGGKIDNG